MLRVAFRCLVAGFFVSSVAYAASDCTPAQESIGGLSFDARPVAVIEKLGEPKERVDLTHELYDTKFVYPDALVYFSEDKLQQFETNRSGLCTPSGICVGSSIADVRRILADSVVESESERESLSCFNMASGCGLVVLLRSNAVSSLRLQCQP